MEIRLNEIIVVDMDEVLVDMSEALYSAIRKNWRKYSFWLEDVGPLSEEELDARPEFDIVTWLIKPQFKTTDTEFRKNKDRIFKELNKDFFNTDYYEKLQPTEFAKKLICNPLVIDNKKIKKVYIVTKYFDDCPEMLASKKKFISRHFNHPKVEAIYVKHTDKKSEYLSSIQNWSMFVEDDLVNIQDVVLNSDDIEGKEFLIPKLGYNQMPSYLERMIRKRKASFSYYQKK